MATTRKNLSLLDPAFKRDALAYLFKDKIAAVSVAEHIPDDFYEDDADLDIIFRVFKEFVAEHGTRPRLHELKDEVDTLCAQFGYDDERIEALDDALDDVWEHTSYTPSRVKKKLFDAVTAHHMYVAAGQIDEYVDDGNYDGLVRIFAEACVTGTDTLPLVEYWNDTNDRIKRRKVNQTRRIPTGMDVLDDLIGGGLPPGALAMLMGASGHGKSALLGQFALESSKAGFTTAYITLELDQDQIMERMDSHNSRIPMGALIGKPGKVAKGVGGSYKNNPVKCGSLHVQYYPTKSISIHQIEDYLNRLRHEAGVTLDALFVDYFGLLKMIGDYKDQWAALQENCELLRGLAGKYQMSIWTADQTNRGGMSKEIVDMDDISGSFGKVFPLDLMVNISQTQSEKIANVMRLHVAKTRLGPANEMVWVEPNFNLMTFEGFDKDEAKTRGLITKQRKKGGSSGSNFSTHMGTQGP